MNFIQLDPASLAIGYVCGTLLCWYLNQTLNAKESEYEREEWIERHAEEEPDNFHNSVYPGNYPYNLSTPDRK